MDDVKRLASSPLPSPVVINDDEHEDLEEQVDFEEDEDDDDDTDPNLKPGRVIIKSRNAGTAESDESSDTEQEDDYEEKTEMDPEVIKRIRDGIKLENEPSKPEIPVVDAGFAKQDRKRGEAERVVFPQRAMKRQRLSESADVPEIDEYADLPDLEDLDDGFCSP